MDTIHRIIISLLAISAAFSPNNIRAKGAETASLPQSEVIDPLLEVPFHKGVNINGWFDRHVSEVNPDKIKDCELDNLCSLGMDVVRLPVNFHSNIGSAPDYRISDSYLTYLDEVINRITSRGLWVIIDHHSLSVETFPQDGEALITSCLKQLALRYKGRDKIVLELFNEPFGDYLQNNWPEMQGRIIKAIRSCDTERILIATPWGCYPERLSELPEYDDPRVIYTFHYYNPLMFTHQDAYWDENLKYLSGYPFPYDASRMPEIHPHWQKEPYLTYLYNNYPNDATVDKIRKDITKAAEWATQHGKLLFCGELGVLNSAKPDDRYRWYKAVGDILAEKNIPWTLWQYNDRQLINFSIFTGAQIFSQLDTEMMEAMGITLPEKYTAGPCPIEIYNDTVEPWCNMRTDKNGGEKYLDYHCHDNPAEGSDCIRYNIANPNGGVWFEMWLPANAGKLQNSGAGLEFMARTTDKIKSLEFYFQHYVDGAPRQWRMSATVSSDGNTSATRQLSPDGKWHKISIPLSEMQYHGCDGEWKDQPDEGESGFDWSRLNWLMVTPNGDKTASGKTIYLDDIRITSQQSNDPYISQNLYFTGDPSGWNFIKMENCGNGLFTYKGKFHANDSFCFTTQEGEDGWNAKIAPSRDITFGLSEFTDNTLTSGSNCAIRCAFDGYYIVSANLSDNTITTVTYNPEPVEKLFVACNGNYNEMMSKSDGTFTWTGVPGGSFVITPNAKAYPRYMPYEESSVIPATGISNGKMIFNITEANNINNRWMTDGSAEFTVNVNPSAMTLNVMGKADVGSITGINVDEENDSANYYDLLGRKVNNPSKGIYIRRHGSISRKAVL